jgi:hypothetical protein
VDAAPNVSATEDPAAVMADHDRVEFGVGTVAMVMPCCRLSVVLRQAEVHPRAWRRIECPPCRRVWRLECISDTEPAWTVMWSEPRPGLWRGLRELADVMRVKR